MFYSHDGKSNKKNFENEKTIKIKDYIEFLNTKNSEYKYVFHKFIMNMNDLILNDINIEKYIKTFNINNLSCRLSEFYLGNLYSGTHLHKHIDVLNFLIYGIKLWIIIPPTRKNINLIKKKNWGYLNITGSIFEFYINNINFILENFSKVFITYQKSGEIIYIPKDYFHFIINFSENIGFTIRFPFN